MVSRKLLLELGLDPEDTTLVRPSALVDLIRRQTLSEQFRDSLVLALLLGSVRNCHSYSFTCPGSGLARESLPAGWILYDSFDLVVAEVPSWLTLRRLEATGLIHTVAERGIVFKLDHDRSWKRLYDSPLQSHESSTSVVLEHADTCTPGDVQVTEIVGPRLGGLTRDRILSSVTWNVIDPGH